MIPGSTTKVSERNAPVLATTTPVISVVADVMHLTGSVGATRVTKLVPNFGGGFSGIVWIFNRNNATITIDQGNMSPAADFLILQNKVAELIYSKQLGKWIAGPATA